MRLVSLVGRVCSSSAQKEGKKAAATLTVDSLDTPSSTALKSWLVVARSASTRVRLIGHLGWVHRQEARAVGRPRERMMPLREALTPRRDRAGLARKTRGAKGGGSSMLHHRTHQSFKAPQLLHIRSVANVDELEWRANESETRERWRVCMLI